MLIKVIGYKRPRYERLLNYLMGHEDRLFDKNGRSFVLTQNFKGRSIPKWVAELQTADKLRPRYRKNANYMTQEILTFRKENAPDLTVEKLRHITKEYMHRRNPRAQYIAVPHFDRGHYHVHILVSAFEYGTGKSLRVSQKQFGNLKKGIQEYVIERYPELQKSAVRHGRTCKSKIKEREYQRKRRIGKEGKQEFVRDLVLKCYKSTYSESDFVQALLRRGLETYTRGGTVYGVISDHKKYRFSTMGIELSHTLFNGEQRREKLNRLRNRNYKEGRIR